ncbi:hypothetical protein MWU53_05730 [Aliiroseovarius sp. S1123]|uniref:hypothetical protein n=1 Tax=unclassified Aliiroseovarius TaxID=2623558 RepID=UPI001FF40B04|nr:hypothetical protein [Aliiroseovarius sp. S1123]MCK0170553.1 hypothetical protein [Aliiroseovarius sp. S1123]
MGKPSQAMFEMAKQTGKTTLAGIAANTALKTAGVSAVKHYGGKMIATKAGAYVAGTIGLPAATVAATPIVTVGAAILTVGLAGGAIVAASRGL